MKRPMQFAVSLLIVVASAAAVVVVSQTVGGSPGSQEAVEPTPQAKEDVSGECPTPAPPPPPDLVVDSTPPPDLTPQPIPPHCWPTPEPVVEPQIPPEELQQRIMVNGVEVLLPKGALFTHVSGEPHPDFHDGTPTSYWVVIYRDSLVKFVDDWVEVDVKGEDTAALAELLDALSR